MSETLRLEITSVSIYKYFYINVFILTFPLISLLQYVLHIAFRKGCPCAMFFAGNRFLLKELLLKVDLKFQRMQPDQ